MGTDKRNNRAYGISCRTRPISIVGSRSDCFETGTAWAVSHRSLQLGRDKRHESFNTERCDQRRARPEKWPDLGPVDCGSKFLSHREATNLIRLNQLTGSTPQEVGLPRRCTSRLRRSHRGHILGVARMLSIRFFEEPPNFFASAWHG